MYMECCSPPGDVYRFLDGFSIDDDEYEYDRTKFAVEVTELLDSGSALCAEMWDDLKPEDLDEEVNEAGDGGERVSEDGNSEASDDAASSSSDTDDSSSSSGSAGGDDGGGGAACVSLRESLVVLISAKAKAICTSLVSVRAKDKAICSATIAAICASHIEWGRQGVASIAVGEQGCRRPIKMV